VYKHRLSWCHKIIMFFAILIHKFVDRICKMRMKAEPSVCQLPEFDLPEEFWTDDSIKNPRA
jgi:hypothetical protein